MDDIAAYLPDVLKVSLAISIGASYWLVRSAKSLRMKLLEAILVVSRKHTLALKDLLSCANKNEIILQGYFIDLNLLFVGRILGLAMFFIVWLILGLWFADSMDNKPAAFVVIAVGNVFIVFSTLLVIHRRERIKDL